MKTLKAAYGLSPYINLFLGMSLIFWNFNSNASPLSLADNPLFLTASVTPIVMLNTSKDHQLYFKAFDDYSDLDNDGLPETTYKHSFNYYGYFDSYKCYAYNTTTKKFEPSSITADKYCSSLWSGNFLNWASMTRIDTIRKILYGGLRSTDTAAGTVLERSYLPNDAHSFAKYYNGSDLNKLAPFSLSASDMANGITLCNTTLSSTSDIRSQDVTDPPLIRVAKGNYALWAANERWQCRWYDEKGSGYGNSNNSALSGLSASSNSPLKSVGLGSKDYYARITVCDSNFLGTENCKIYPDGTRKPIGLLQTYGDDNRIRFGLMSGSYGKSKSGGVLRKNASSITDEINTTTNGTFKAAPATGGIINVLNKVRTYGYNHNDGTYFSGTGNDNCTWGLNTFSNGSCSNWGNPQSEILLESLRYLGGKNALATFNVDDSTRISGLKTATPTEPLTDTQWCASLNAIQFNASTSSYDGDELGNVTDIGATAMNTLTNAVGTGENLTGNSYFIGENGTNNNQLCTEKSITNLSDVRGTCPDAPRLSGSYHIAGLASYAHTNDIDAVTQGSQQVTTYGVALSPALPKIVVSVPGTSKQITLMPACRNSSVGGNCAIVDFKIVHQDCSLLTIAAEKTSGTSNCGKIMINWEDSEQGGDFDQDMWGTLTYSVNSTQAIISTISPFQSTPYAMGFGYIISGTTNDGFHAKSGINSYTGQECTNCKNTDSETRITYTIGASTGLSLQQPLYYAAKWGAFNDFDNSKTPNASAEWDSNNDGKPDRYFFAIDPKMLETSLSQALSDVLKRTAAAASAAANSTSLQSGTVIYQAQFDSTDWSGHLYNFTVSSDGTVHDLNGDGKLNGFDANWDSAILIPDVASRNVLTHNGTSGTSFDWVNLSAAQKTALETDSSGIVGTTTDGQNRLNWLKGDTSKEVRFTGGVYRNRTTTVQGDSINSDPIYSYKDDFGYSSLPSTASGQSTYSAFVTGKVSRPPIVYIGANDGMLHGFRADVGNTNSGKEMFAYVPAGVYTKLSALTETSYTHKYLVDGSPSIGDAYLSGWKTILMGGLNSGGKSIYALDISNPAGFSGSNVLWEYFGLSSDTGSTGTTDIDGMGNTYSQPQIARLNDGTWAAIFGNGYNSVSEKAFLYIVDLSNGTLIKKIPTNSSVSNGLSTPKLYDSNGDKIIDAVYAGDLQGNLWKFDLSASTSASWGLGNGGSPLFIARNASNKIQPITSQPAIGSNTNGGVLVYFGTGSYLTNADVANTDVQSFYAIWDKPSTTGTVARSVLVQQTITAQIAKGTTQTNADGTTTTFGFDVRTTSANTVDYTTTKRGWYMDLVPPNGNGGERVISTPLVKLDRVIFLTAIPSTDPCIPGGDSWLMELSLSTGGATTTSSFDFNNDKKFDENDKVKSSGSTVSGVKSNAGLVKAPVWLDETANPGVAVKEMSGTSGNIMSLANKGVVTGSGTTKLLFWQQIQ
jgi:type IV pilus assembly protein PilY1